MGTVPQGLCFVVLGLVLPGWALLRLARLRTPDAALLLPLGFAWSAGVYWLSLVSGAPLLFPLATLGLVVAGATVGTGTVAARPVLRDAGPAGLAVIALLALVQYPRNRLDASGAFLLDPFVASDTTFHVGLSRELTLGWPPQVPGLAGFPLGYHFGTDLVRAAALRWAGLDPFDGINRVDVTIFALALAFTLPGLARACGGGDRAARLAPWTLLFTDLSFVAAGLPEAHWWADLFRGNLLISLAVANPLVPALALAAAGLLGLERHRETGERGWLVLATLLLAAVPFFKVFLGAAVGGALLAVAVQQRRAMLGGSALPAIAATTLLVAGQGGATVAVVFAPFDLAAVTRDTLGLSSLDGFRFAVWAAGWLVVSLGLRVLGIAPAVRALQGDGPAAPVLAIVALAAWPLGLLLRISAPDVLPGQRVVNDAAYLVEQGGPLLWIFTAVALEAFAARRRAAWLLLVLALPATAQFAIAKTLLPADPIPATYVRAMRGLAGHTQPGEVVLQRPAARFPPAPVIFASRRVPYERFTPWLTQFAPPDALAARHDAVYRFFRTTDGAEAGRIAASLGARILCLYGTDRVRFPSGPDVLPVIVDEGSVRCHEIHLPGP